MYKFLQKVQVFLIDYIGGGTREVISDFNGSLGSQHFLYAMNERTSFASLASAFESSRLVIGLKLNIRPNSCLRFLLRLNEISGGCEKIVLVSELF